MSEAGANTPRRAARPPAQRLRDALLLVLAGATALGIGILAVWILAPDRVDALDRRLRDARVARVDDRLAAAEAALAAGRSADGRRRLEALLAELEDVQKRDRFHRRKRRAFELLALELSGGDTEAALRTTERWLSFDPRDVEARVVRARLLASRAGGGAEARAQLAELSRRLPAVAAVALAHVDVLLRDGRSAEAREALLAAARRLPWTVTWTGGRGFERGRRQREILPRWSGGTLAFETALPSGVESIALRAPEGLAFEIAVRTARLEGEAGRAALDLLGAGATACAAPAPGAAAPVFCWRPAAPLEGAAGALLRVSAEARPLLPDALRASRGPVRGGAG